MLFNSIEFLVFFAIVYPLYLLLKHHWQNRLLILASCVFYAAWNWKFLPVMFISITTDFYCCKYMGRSSDPKLRRRLLILSVFVNRSILGFFKYCNFFADNLHSLLSPFFPFTVPEIISKIILPVGVSFYTFEAISYTVDVYRGIMQPTRRYWDYVLFVIYFPHLVAGPIMRAKDFLPQITVPRKIKLAEVSEGTFLIFWGLFEKIFIASNLARIVDPIFLKSAPYQGSEVLIGLYAFAFQIFCDFDAYSNIARGLGKCMGFDIVINFNLPYFATSPREFWQRWHISLSSWLRDYLYIPLGGNRRGTGATCQNLLITMLLGGLWHGASWTFVIWGAYHGLLLIIFRAYEIMKYKSTEPPPPRGLTYIFRVVLMFHLVALGWLFFRAHSFTQIIQMSQAVLCNFSFNPEQGTLLAKFFGFTTPLLLIQVGQFRTNDLLFLHRQHWLIKTIVYAILSYLVLGWGVMTAEEFIYFQF